MLGYHNNNLVEKKLLQGIQRRIFNLVTDIDCAITIHNLVRKRRVLQLPENRAVSRKVPNRKKIGSH